MYMTDAFAPSVPSPAVARGEGLPDTNADILADLFPDREITGIYSGDLVWGYGTLHCMTQQQPVAKPTENREQETKN